MTPFINLRAGLIIWLITATIIVWVQRRRKETGVGLVLAYLAIVWLQYWLGAFIYALPWYVPRQIPYWLPNRLVVEAGFEQVVYATLAFALGVLFFGPMLRRLFFSRPRRPHIRGSSLSNIQVSSLPVDNARLPRVYFFTGLFSYLVLDPLLGGLPTVTALISAATMLMVVGICLGAWQAWHTGNRRAFALWLLAGVSQPFLTLMVKGFLVHGLAGAVMVFAFVWKFMRSPKAIVLGLIAIYVSLSIYVSYMRDRPAIRAVLWSNAPSLQKAERIYETLSTLEWFDIHNSDHLGYIDDRLNTNILVGSTVYNLRQGYQRYAYGATILWAVIALIPRALWPTKPISAGSSTTSTLSNFSNIRFSSGTSVAMGFVAEFYLNFGTIGVIVGFFLLGGVMYLEDHFAAYYLLRQNWMRFALWLLPGIFVLHDGILFETSASAGSAVVIATLVNHFLYRRRFRRTPVLNGVRTFSVIEPK